MTVFWDSASLIVLMMEAADTSETSVNLYQTTWRNIPEDSRLHTCRRENLKSHTVSSIIWSNRSALYSGMDIKYKKSKAVLLHAMEALEGRGGLAPTHSWTAH
jgi:hypothetical protein